MTIETPLDKNRPVFLPHVNGLPRRVMCVFTNTIVEWADVFGTRPPHDITTREWCDLLEYMATSGPPFVDAGFRYNRNLLTLLFRDPDCYVHVSFDAGGIGVIVTNKATGPFIACDTSPEYIRHNSFHGHQSRKVPLLAGHYPSADIVFSSRAPVTTDGEPDGEPVADCVAT